MYISALKSFSIWKKDTWWLPNALAPVLTQPGLNKVIIRTVHPSYTNRTPTCTNLIAVEDVGQFICSQLSVGPDAGARPAHPHLSGRHRLKLKVPLSLGHRVRLLCPEDSYFVPADVLEAMASCSEGDSTIRMAQRSKCPCFSIKSVESVEVDLLPSWSGGSML